MTVQLEIRPPLDDDAMLLLQRYADYHNLVVMAWSKEQYAVIEKFAEKDNVSASQWVIDAVNVYARLRDRAEDE